MCRVGKSGAMPGGIELVLATVVIDDVLESRAVDFRVEAFFSRRRNGRCVDVFVSHLCLQGKKKSPETNDTPNGKSCSRGETIELKLAKVTDTLRLFVLRQKRAPPL